MAGITEGSGVQCAFCGRPIDDQGPDPVRLLIEVARVGGNQEVWAHWSCLRDRLHNSVPLLE